MRKTLFAFMACMFIFISCSKDDDDINEVIPTKEFGNHFTNEPFGWLDEAGVRIWGEFEIDKMDVSRHVYDGVDDGLMPTIGHELFYICDDTSNVSVKWTSNSEIVRVNERKMWLDYLKKWEVTSIAIFEPTVLKNLYLEAFVEFPDTTVRRCCVYPEIVVHDYGLFDFGVHRSEIKIKKDLSPTMSIPVESSNCNSTILEFENDKLVKVYSVNIPSNGDIIYLSERCNIPDKLQLTKPGTDFTIANPQEWIYGDLKFKAFNIDLTAYDLGIQACISAELK